MSLTRAFTTRRVRQVFDFKDGNESDASLRKSSKLYTHGSIRHKISAPVELTHTTNMLSYEAPDIHQIKSTMSIKPTVLTQTTLAGKVSDDESDTLSNATSTPPTSPETSSPDGRRSMSPEPNHLSCYFSPSKPQTATDAPASVPSTPAEQPATSFSAAAAPLIPQRAPSHTKKAYEGLTRHRSVSRLSENSSRSLSSKASFSFSRSSSTSTNTSVGSLSHTASLSHSHKPSLPSVMSPSAVSLPSPPMSISSPPLSHKMDFADAHPFGHELAKVSELVEEFGKENLPQTKIATRIAPVAPVAALAPITPITPVTPTSMDAIMEEEERELARRGLKKFTAEEYISEIQDLMYNFLGDTRPMTAAWI